MINQEIKKIADNLNLEIIKFIIDDRKKNNFVILCQENKRRIILKITSKKNKDIAKDHAREHFNTNIISKFNTAKPFENQINVSKAISMGGNQKYLRISREYINGDSLSSNMSAYDIINEKFLIKKSVLLPQIIKIITNFHKVGRQLSPEDIAGFERINSYHFKTDMSEIVKIRRDQDLEFDITKQIKFYNSVKKRYFSNQSIIIGDFHPANILIDKNDKVFVTDLCNMSFDNHTFDTAYLWLFLWSLPLWQKEITDKLILSSEEQDYFRASIIRIILPVAWKNEDKIKSSKYSEHRMKYWKKYLLAAGESFEAIMNVK